MTVHSVGTFRGDAIRASTSAGWRPMPISAVGGGADRHSVNASTEASNEYTVAVNSTHTAVTHTDDASVIRSGEI